MITSTAIGTGGLGRFGNQCFTIAGVIGIAVKNNQPYGFPKWENKDNALFGDEVTDFSEHFVNPLPEIPEGLHVRDFREYGYFWGYRDVSLPFGNWSINAHLQSPKFFEHCMGKVREQFRMKNEQEQNDFVAIHYRAGDYIDDPKAYHPRLTSEYYEAAYNKFSRWNNFILFTDDLEAAKTVFGFMPSFMYRVEMLSKESYLADFKLMKKCKSFIIANSSFSAMAAHLGEHPEKKVIAPKLWFGEQANGMDTKDIYDKNWIVI